MIDLNDSSIRWIGMLVCLVWTSLGPVGTAVGQQTLQAGFERDVNRYAWISEANAWVGVGSWKMDVQNRFRSDAFILYDDQLSFRDENRLLIRAIAPTKGGVLERVAIARADWYSLSRVFRQDSWFGIRYGKNKPFWIEPLLGLVIDSRPGFGVAAEQAPIRTDVGPGFGLQFGMPSQTVSGYVVEVRGGAQLEQYAPRVGQLFRTMASAGRMFDNTTIRTRLEAASVRRDAYQSASFLNREEEGIRKSETVESTRSDTLNLYLEVDSHVAEPLWITGGLDVLTNSRSVQTLRAPTHALFFDSNFNRRTVEANLAFRWVKRSTSIRIAAIAGAEVERRRLDNADDLPSSQAAQKLSLLRQADNDRGYLSLQQSIDATVRPWWRIQFDGSAHILRHDTPDINPDDRDELLFNAQFGSLFRIREGLEFTFQVLGSWFHTVYIKADRSAENNVQRSLRYRPSVDWRPNRQTKIRVGSEVRATYTVDDFLLPGRRPTDQAAREMRHEIEIEHAPTEQIRVLVSTRFSDLRLGRFLDKVFAEIPFDTLKTYSGWARIQTGKTVQAEVGLKYFIRTDFDRSASVRYTVPSTDTETSISRMGRTRIDQIGPTTAISWYMRANSFLRLEGWAMVQRISHQLYGELPEGLESTISKAASKGQTTIIPNVSVTMQWAW